MSNESNLCPRNFGLAASLPKEFLLVLKLLFFSVCSFKITPSSISKAFNGYNLFDP